MGLKKKENYLNLYDKGRVFEEKHKLWIAKPANSSCGRGIKILTKKTKNIPRKL